MKMISSKTTEELKAIMNGVLLALDRHKETQTRSICDVALASDGCVVVKNPVTLDIVKRAFGPDLNAVSIEDLGILSPPGPVFIDNSAWLLVLSYATELASRKTRADLEVEINRHLQEVDRLKSILSLIGQ